MSISMSKNFLSLFSSNFQIICSTVSARHKCFVSLSRLRYHDRNNRKTALFSMKSRVSIGSSRLLSSEDNNNERLMTEEDRKMLEEWIEMSKFQGERVPQNISEDQFLELFKAKNELLKKRYLNYLVKREAAKANSKLLKEREKILKAERREEKQKIPIGHIEYGLWRNALFAKTNKRHISDHFNYRLASAMIHGQPLVLDLGFDDFMKGREITSYVEQLSLAISLNKVSPDPFNLTFCNVDFDSKPFHKFTKFMDNVVAPSFPMNISSKSYLDMFPKEKLVYLTPNAKQEMTKFDHNAIYIIGGIVDLGVQKPLTLAKAKREGIKMQKLPLDQHHIFKSSKSLGLHVMIRILLDVQEDGDWKRAFRNIPRRLISTADSEENHTRWNEKRRFW